eukprot:2547286-Amphidinium_carterae.1
MVTVVATAAPLAQALVHCSLTESTGCHCYSCLEVLAGHFSHHAACAYALLASMHTYSCKAYPPYISYLFLSQQTTAESHDKLHTLKTPLKMLIENRTCEQYATMSHDGARIMSCWVARDDLVQPFKVGRDFTITVVALVFQQYARILRSHH